SQSTDISYRQLAWCTTWYIREETLEAAFTNLVNYHHKLPLSQMWGSGILSSSDGQRFPVSGKNPTLTPARYTHGLIVDQIMSYGIFT
ncbi:MAG TPA: Tn3 family transposase, partial [Pyrinomonadaceae bacterium]|nr:Tn3 family transposase [Pyrinomonadaceae bacterium]